MNGKTILVEPTLPTTQSVEAVKSLITAIHHGHEPAEMPPFFRMSAGMVLVQSSKKGSYYVTTVKECSCPARAYHPGQACKHMKRFFPAAQIPKKTLLEEMKEPGYEMSFEPEDSDKSRSAKIKEAKAKVAESKRQAREYQAKTRLARNLAKLGQAEPVDSTILKNAGSWAGGHNGPVEVV